MKEAERDKRTDDEIIAACAPGIRRTVRWLRELGFRTTDSGDGKTNLEAGMGCAVDFPMVVMVPKGDLGLRRDAAMLQFALAARGIKLDGKDIEIEASINLSSETETILLRGVDDAMLFGATDSESEPVPGSNSHED